MTKRILHFKIQQIAAAILCIALAACSPPKGRFAGNPTGTDASSYSGYVVIANNVTKTVNLYDKDLIFIRTLLTLGSTDVPASLAMYDSTQILVAIEGGASAQDRVIRVNLDSSNDFVSVIQDAVNFTGVSVKGVARLSGGDILASDSATITAQLERYVPGSGSTLASRVAIGWPLALQASTTMVFPGPSNSFTECSNGTSDLIRTYSNAGVQTGSATALLPVPSLGSAHDVNGCVFDPSNRVAALFNGTSDSLRVYTTSALTTIAWTFTDLTKFANPQALAVRPNGNFLVAEFVTPNDYIVEISSTGTYVQTFVAQGTATINAILVVP